MLIRRYLAQHTNDEMRKVTDAKGQYRAFDASLMTERCSSVAGFLHPIDVFQ
jgi:hypothetical protein